MPQGQVTIRQIAVQARVSHSTVSRALNNSPSISQDTRNHIRRIATDMGYQTNPLVAAWMSHVRRVKTPHWTQGTIGYLETIDRDEYASAGRRSFFLRCKQGAAQRGKELGYHLKVLRADDFAGNLEGLNRMIQYGAIDGVIFPQTHLVELDFDVKWESVAGCIIGFRLEYPPFHRVCVDAFSNVSLVMKSLTARGYRRIGLALTPALDNLVNHVWNGSVLAFQHSELNKKDIVPPILIPDGDFSQFKKWYQRYRPEVILQCQRAVRELIGELDVDVPNELALVELNVKKEGEPIAGIDQDLERVGAVAIEQVIVVTADPQVRAGMHQRLSEMQERLRAMEAHVPVPTGE